MYMFSFFVGRTILLYSQNTAHRIPYLVDVIIWPVTVNILISITGKLGKTQPGR